MPKSFAACAVVATLSVLACPAMAQTDEQPTYLDDRSTPEQLVLSYFNAINRGEYARAHGYFGAETAPGFDSWQFRFDDVVKAEVGFGEMAQEGAAGSIYYQFPVTVDYEHAEGQHHIERGCINIRWVNPANQQRPPFTPMYILSADLHGVEEEQGLAPARCFSAPNKDAGSPPMLDDRSTPEQVIRSYYNAIETGEYGRASAYLGKQPENYDAWWQSFADYGHAELSFGMPSHYSTAGYILFSVPVSVVVTASGGGEDWVEVGCIGVFQELGTDEAPYTPSHITGVKLERKAAGVAYALPACDD